jgi:polyisoprenoid-binding protein YceI
MRTTVPSVVLGLALLQAGAAHAQERTRFDIDPDHSTVQFEVDHLSLSRGYGRFDKVNGYVIEDADPAHMQVVVEIDPSSINSGFQKRDDHLKSPDFLNVKQFRDLSFKSKKVEKLDQKKFRITGDMKMHGVTKEIAVVAEKLGEGKDPWGGTRSGYKARWDLKRSDYGMNFLLEGGALGDKIDVVVLLETVKKK